MVIALALCCWETRGPLSPMPPGQGYTRLLSIQDGLGVGWGAGLLEMELC